MIEPAPQKLIDLLQQHGQQHVLHWWDDLDSAQRHALAEQIHSVDFAEIESALSHLRTVGTMSCKANEIQPAGDVVRLPKRQADKNAWTAAAERGEQALIDGKVGVILVAGGQGTRLGFESPKGMLPISLVTGATLYQLLAEQLLARSRRAGKTIPYYVMTSDATHDETLAFFEQHDYFGLKSQDVCFFRQGKMPAVDKQTGRLLLAEKGSLAMSPDGHGGLLEALQRSGGLDDMQRRGVEYLYYHQVDNPTAIVCDPAFIGFHILSQSELSTKVVAKRAATERMGVIVGVGGNMQIIEYFNLPRMLAEQVDENGNLAHWAGNTAIHVLSREFLDRLVRDSIRLPLHPSEKKVPFLDDAGNVVAPEVENAFKFERFIFDALPLARKTLVVEADRAREFNPVKNAEGSDTPASARAAMCTLFGGWLRAAGVDVPHGVPIEISPLFALDENELKEKLPRDYRFDGPIVLS